MLMKKSLLLVAVLAAAASSASAGPLDNYQPSVIPPQVPVETARKWLTGTRTEFDGTVTTRTYTFNESGYPTGYRQLVAAPGGEPSQSEADVCVWDAQGHCVSQSYGDYQLVQFGYDEYGRVVSYKLTTYDTSGGNKEVSELRTAEYAYDDTGNMTLNATKNERFQPQYYVYGSKWVKTTETAAEGAVVETTVSYQWDTEAGDWKIEGKTESKSTYEGATRTINTHSYGWDAATAAWRPSGKGFARYKSDLIPGVEMPLVVESTMTILDADGKELYLYSSVTGTMTPKDGEYEYAYRYSRYNLDAAENTVESFSESRTNIYETYTADDGSTRTFVKFLSSVHKNRDDSSGEMVVTYQVTENGCRYGTLNLEHISSYIGQNTSRQRFEYAYDNLGRQTSSANYGAMGDEEYREEMRTATEYLDDTRAVASFKRWRYSSYEGGLALQEEHTYEYDPSVAADEVVALPSQIPGDGTLFMVVKQTGRYAGLPEQVDTYTYADRSEMVGVENVAADSDEADSSLPAEIFTLGGVKVGEFASPRDAGLPTGLYIERRGTSARKIRL